MRTVQSRPPVAIRSPVESSAIENTLLVCPDLRPPAPTTIQANKHFPIIRGDIPAACANHKGLDTSMSCGLLSCPDKGPKKLPAC